MGDVIMSSPAFHALKKSFNCRITLLTSAGGSLISNFIPDVDETIITDLPWVKINQPGTNTSVENLITILKIKQFDAAVIFTVYSQSALPAAMLAYMADIPERIAYCRENPYDLLTTWLPDKEPYSFIQHQVERDLKLVSSIGADINDKRLQLKFNDVVFESVKHKLGKEGITLKENYIILHPGVTEKKREYPSNLWIEIIEQLNQKTDLHIFITGTVSEQNLINLIINDKENVHSLAGKLSIEELINFTKHAAAVCCVNTVIAHIAAAAETPVVVLYAQTNPQHTPWCNKKSVLYFSVEENLKSKNEIIKYVNEKYYSEITKYPSPETVVDNILNWI